MKGFFVDQKLVVELSVEIEGHAYRFTMPVGSPVGNAYTAAFKALDHITALIKDATEKSKPAEKESVEPELVQHQA